MAEGDTVLVNPSLGYDCIATKMAMEAFGVHFEEGTSKEGVVWRIRSRGVASWSNPEAVIDAANSGTTARLLLGVGSAVDGLRFEITGDESLKSRPMSRIVDPLRSVGCQFQGHDGGRYLPFTVIGKSLKGFKVRSDVVSAQVKTALLLAATQAEGRSIINVPLGTRDHTERVLTAMGAPLTCEVEQNRGKYTFEGPWKVEPFIATIPKDPSAMAFFATLAFIHPGLIVKCPGVLYNDGRAHYLAVLERAGLTIRRKELEQSGCPGEKLADFEFVRTGGVIPIEVSPQNAPQVIDEIPALAIAATVCQGESRLLGLGELRVKESDRISEIVRLLTHAGIDAVIDGADLRITPKRAVKGFEYRSDDHRMVMAAGVLATTADGPVKLGPASAVRVSFPLFFEQLQQIFK